MNDTLEFFSYLIATAIVLLMVALGDYSACNRKAALMSLNYSWGPLQGCMVEYKKNKWVDIKAIRIESINLESPK